MKDPLISVIMPAYNAEPYIKQAIDSILDQTYPHFELLVADDKSTDKTRSLIDSYKDSRIKTFHNNENKGYLTASNLLFDKAKGDYVTFQDADDLSDNNRLQLFLNEFKKDPALGCIGSFVKRINESNEVTGTIGFKCESHEIANDLPIHFNCVGSALMIRRGVLEKVGYYTSYFDRLGSEDLYWYGKIVRDFKTINIPAYLYYYRATPGSVSMNLHKPIKKQAAKELASHALQYYFKTGTEIFQDKKALQKLELFLFGKYNCWNKKFRKGVKLLLRSVFTDPCHFTEKYSLLKVYIPQAIKQNNNTQATAGT